jgi:hypothetical protein
MYPPYDISNKMEGDDLEDYDILSVVSHGVI